MDYFWIFILQLIGIGFHVGQKIYELDKLSPDDSLEDVFNIFWKSDRVTVFISVVILAFNLSVHSIMHDYGPKSILDYEYYHLISFAIALVLGYAGQRIVYGALGKAVDFAEKKINDKLQ